MIFRNIFGYVMLFGCLCVQTAFSQSIDQIKKSNDYYWGEGVGSTSSLADKDALSSLINSISVNVESKYSSHAEQLTRNGNMDFKQTVNNIVQTHSNATIKNTEILTWGEEPEVHVFRYVKRTEIYKIFAERERKVREFVVEARRAEEKHQIADALRYYYWALMLLQSMPSAESITMQTGSNEQKLDVYLPQKINEIINALDFRVTGKQVDENITQYLLGISYNGYPVRNCDYSFFDGRNWSLPIGAKDGRGIAELTGDVAIHKTVRLKIEYAFENEWKVDHEVQNVLSKVEPIIFRKSYIDLPLQNIQEQTSQNETPVVANAEEQQIRMPDTQIQSVDGSEYLSMLERVENAIRNKNYESVRDCFTVEGYDVFIRLIQYGRAVILSKSNYSFLKFEDGIQVRSLPMRFSFTNNRRQFVEDVIFDISQSEGKIRSLSFALPNDVCREITQYDQWDEYSRLAIINFIENYKTAYALKRLEYIESIFSDNALIIVGKVVKHLTSTDTHRATLNTNIVKMTQYNKGQYIKQLSAVFKSNEYVNLKFTDIGVKKAGVGGEIYGIQLKQDYFSTSYGDTGYLFLMVDLNKKEEPVIHIRTWQPEKDPDFGVYDISNF